MDRNAITYAVTLKTKVMDLSSLISHELKNPLAIIKESIALIENTQLGPITAQQQEVMGICLRNVDRLIYLINDMRDFSRLRKQIFKFSPSRINLHELIEEIVNKRKTSTAITQYNFQNASPGQGSLCRCDIEQTARAIDNILNHLIAASQDKQINITVQHQKKILKISCSAKTPQLKKNDLQRIFYPFEQAITFGRKSSYETGLELIIAYEIIRQQKGSIKINYRNSENVLEFLISFPCLAR